MQSFKKQLILATMLFISWSIAADTKNNSLQFQQNQLTVNIHYQNKSYRITLYETDVFSPSFNVITSRGNQAVNKVRTYRGRAQSDNYIPVTALVSDHKIRMTINEQQKFIIAESPLNKSSLNFQFTEKKLSEANDKIEYRDAIANHNSLPALNYGKSQKACGVKRVVLSFDCSGDCYNHFNNDLNQLNQSLATAINELNLIYVRDLRLEYQLGSVVVCDDSSTDPYSGMTDWNDLLETMRSDWNANSRGDFDMAALIDPDVGGGLAYVGTVCTQSKYSINGLGGSFLPILRHELGHNFGSNHFEGDSPEGETIMSGNSIARFSGPEKDKIIAHRDSRSCLEDIGNYATPVVPYAHFDDSEVDQNESILIKVLDNDEDANCDTLTLDSADTTSTLGNRVSISGNDIVYEANTTNTGTDSFTYKVTDGTGNSSTGNVRVKVNAVTTVTPLPTPTPEPPASSGGGSINIWSLLLLALISIRRRFRIERGS